METIFEHAGGYPALHRFVDIFYGSVLADPLLQPLFGAGKPEHVAQLTAFDAESFGGPDAFTREMGGFGHLIEVHRGLRITEAQRQRKDREEADPVEQHDLTQRQPLHRRDQKAPTTRAQHMQAGGLELAGLLRTQSVSPLV